MAEYQLTTFLISFLIIGSVVAGLGIVFAGFSEEYGMNYDNTTLDSYNQMKEINEISEDMNEKASGYEQSSFTDVIGAYITQGYDTVVITFKSMSLFGTMANEGVDSLNAGPMAANLRVVLIASISIIVILGIVVAAIMKWRF